jgi:AcrR family transcriptional regulator
MVSPRRPAFDSPAPQVYSRAPEGPGGCVRSEGTALISDAKGGRDRRDAILGALYRCMATKGFAATTLSDIAREAGMSSSHLLYYFSGKEAIIEAFFKVVSEIYQAEFDKLPKNDPVVRLDALADLMLRHNSKADQAVLMDLYGQAVQNKAMRRMRIADDRRIRGMLTEVFEQTPRMLGMSAEDAAEIAYATLVGLRATSFYDPSMGPNEVSRLLRSAWHKLAGVKPASVSKPPRGKAKKS